MDHVQISKKKLPYPVSSRFHLYLDDYGRELDFSLKYEDLWGWSEAIALEDNARPNLKTVQGLGRNYSWKERFGKEFCTHGNG